MNKLFFVRKSEMTDYAEVTGLEYFRTKQKCNHTNYPRPAIIIVSPDQTIVARLIKCKPCAIEMGNYSEIPGKSDESRQTGKGVQDV